MPDHDRLNRFLFDDSDIRGELITLESSYQQVLKNGDYPEPVGVLLGEMLAAAGLLSATMKFDGTLILQARGAGSLSLVMADCTRQHLLRAIARTASDASFHKQTLGDMLGKGHLAITIDPVKGERYQGIVPLEAPSLAGCLEDYFAQSEQLPTRLWLFADGQRAGGLLLQALPSKLQKEQEKLEYWQHLTTLADTLESEEFLSTTTETMLTRLFHSENLRLLPGTEMSFSCSCSQTRTAAMLGNLGEHEVRDILNDEGIVEVTCEFCHQTYRFDTHQIDTIFNDEDKTLH